MPPQNDQPESQFYVGTENFVTIRLLYHLWRLDSAARAFPRNLSDEVDLNAAKARWTIGLTLEMHGIRESAADITLVGLMTETLSRELANRIRWFDMGSPRHDAIIWELLPNNETSPPVPSPPWIFSYEPHLISARNRWWEDPNEGNGKPDWWDDAVPEKWLYHVSVPRSLIGEYLSAIKDSQKLLFATTFLLTAKSEAPDDSI